MAKAHDNSDFGTGYFSDCAEDLEEHLMVVDGLRASISNLQLKTLEELEICFQHVLPSIVQTLQQIFSKNSVMFSSIKPSMIEPLRANFQGSLNLMGISREILDDVIRRGSFTIDKISSVPVNIPYILLITFEHCRISQKYCKPYAQSLGEILELFRKTQELHSIFLNFLDNNIIVSSFDEEDVTMYQDIVGYLLKIGKILTGVNMKSMVDNWKGFITFTQKLSEPRCWTYNLSKAIQVLSEDINNNLISIYKMGTTDVKANNQTIKMTGFLIKVVLKLAVNKLNTSENYEDLMKFWIMISNWHVGLFQTNNFPDEIVDLISALLTLCSEALTTFLKEDREFTKFCLSYNYQQISKCEIGYLQLILVVLEQLPILLQNQGEKDFSITPIIGLIFTLIPKCYELFFNDYNSKFCENLIINISVMVLLCPNEFPKVEILLLKNAVDDNIWLSLIAIETWSLILKNASQKVCRETLDVLLSKIEMLSLDKYYESPPIVRLKILTNRIYKMLPQSAKIDVLTTYNPSNNLAIWKILNIKIIPLSHRYYIEVLISHILETSDDLKMDQCSMSDMVKLLENLNVLSNANLSDLEIKTSRVVPVLISLWNFEETEIVCTNNFFKYYIYVLLKVTISILGEFEEAQILQILTKVKYFTFEQLNNLLVCDLLKDLPRTNLHRFNQKSYIVSIICDIFHILLNDKSLVIVQKAIEGISSLARNNITIISLLNSSSEVKRMVSNFSNKTAHGAKYDTKYLHAIQQFSYQHRCVESSRSEEPCRKKIKLDDEVEVVVHKLMKETETLLSIGKTRLDGNQKNVVRNVINKLKTIVN